MQNISNKNSNASVNAPLPTSPVREAKEFVFAFLIVAAAFTAGHLIIQNSHDIAQIMQIQNQANALGSQSSTY